MSRLVETIRAEDGILKNISWHNERFIRSMYEVFGLQKVINLENIITVPPNAYNGLFKCRVEYDTEIRKVEFLRYEVKPVKTLKLIEDNRIEYRYKYTDRSAFERLLSEKEGCDDIIIIKNGYVTDSSFSNLVFRDSEGKWVTPSTCLLEGTRRKNLLQNGIISEANIHYRDISRYSEVKLINAMMDIPDCKGIPVSKII